MSTEFDELSDALVAVVLEPEPGKRQVALDKWKAAAIPALQAALPEAVERFLSRVTAAVGTDDGWAARESRWRDSVFQLVLDIRLREVGRWETDTADSRWYVTLDPR